MTNIANCGKGAVRQPIDLRDYRLEPVIGAEMLPKEYSLRINIGSIKNQDGSSSCVGQAFSYYAEVLNKLETGEYIALSARDIYSLIYLPEGGAHLRDAASKITNSGVVREFDATSYLGGLPPTEEFMRTRDDITPAEEETGMDYLAKSYLTWGNTNFEAFKRAIYQGKGCVIACYGNNFCWKDQMIIVPDDKSLCDWGHAVYCCGWVNLLGKEYLEFVNSWGNKWGDKGFGYLPKEYVEKGLIFNPVTLIDLPNNTYPTQMKLIAALRNLVELYKQLIEKLKGK